ncbi:MAG TPA: HD domain-containing phosphohydrolase [Longimicrobiales bacterium]|nr:HD domain-containing phosphohydrolase [Longimicrobiales bacterium]
MNEQHLSLAEILAALSHALDLTEGQPDGHTIRSCLIGMRLAETLELDEAQRACLYYALLLKDAGCSAYAAPIARRERGAEIVRQLGFPDATARAVYALDEHWNGGGHPDGLAGEEIPTLARIASIAQTVDVFAVARGVDATMAMLRDRRGRWFEPRLVDEVLTWRTDRAWWALMRGAEATDAVLEAEPDDRLRSVDADGLDSIAGAFAEIIDARSPYTSSHSRGVARYAVAIGHQMGLEAVELRDLRRGGLLHDIGELGVSSRILDKPGALTRQERTAIERHPAYGWRILKRVRAFRSFAWEAVLHHERLDGGGYPWGIDASELGLATRILSAADVFEALTARRPYRDPVPPMAALGILHRERGNAFDAEVVAALDAALTSGSDEVLGAA